MILLLFLGFIVAHQLVCRLNVSNDRFQWLSSKISLRVDLIQTCNNRIVVTRLQVDF